MLLQANDDLSIPAFLRPTGPAKKVKERRWKKLPKATRPEGERWVEAERWEVFITNTKASALAKLGSGKRLVWAAEAEDGSAKMHVRDGAHEVTISLADWRLLIAKGRKVAS
jgi:hypothetical protein